MKNRERIDEIGFGGLKLIQDEEDFCYGVDSVIVADFAARNCKRPPQAIVDLGAGSGVISLILAHKTGAERITGVEFQPAAAERAARSAALNGLEGRISILNEDVAQAGETWAAELKGSFDLAVSNPPYFPCGSGPASPRDAKAAARHETTAGLREFLGCAAYLLRPRGETFLIHRPSRLADVFCFGREVGLEPKEMRLVRPSAGADANMVLVHLIAGGGRELKVLPDLVVYGEDGGYTEELLRAYERA